LKMRSTVRARVITSWIVFNWALVNVRLMVISAVSRSHPLSLWGWEGWMDMEGVAMNGLMSML
jgi:hypothetical protein